MHLDVLFTPIGITENDIRDKAIVVLEVLRTSSTIITALQNGAKSVVPAATLGDAARMGANLDPKVFLFGGETGGVKIDGSHLGNSPLEYTTETVGGRTVIMHTSNATGAVVQCRSAASVVVGGFLNLTRVVNHILQTEDDVLIICGGRKNHASLADAYCVGQIVDLLVNVHHKSVSLSDEAYISHSMYVRDKQDITRRVSSSNIGQLLKHHGFEADIPYSCAVDHSAILPTFDASTLALHAG